MTALTRRRGGIPDRWLKYQPIGRVIDGTRFICFKTPLHESLVQNIPDNNRLTCKILVNKLPNLGLIIDLTYTNYYDPEFFKNENIKYKKIMIPGHQIPPGSLVKQFKDIVHEFLDNNRHNAKLIGVHCTHGVNRTGYLICSYMITEIKFIPDEAIRRFNRARGNNIERENYINSLRTIRSNNSRWKQIQHRQKNIDNDSRNQHHQQKNYIGTKKAVHPCYNYVNEKNNITSKVHQQHHQHYHNLNKKNNVCNDQYQQQNDLIGIRNCKQFHYKYGNDQNNRIASYNGPNDQYQQKNDFTRRRNYYNYENQKDDRTSNGTNRCFYEELFYSAPKRHDNIVNQSDKKHTYNNKSVNYIIT